MPLPLTVSCISKVQVGFTFLVPAYLGSPGKSPLNGCLCVSVMHGQCNSDLQLPFHQTWNWVNVSFHSFGSSFTSGSSFWPGVRSKFFRFSKKCPKCKTYIWNAQMTKVSVRCLLLDWNLWMSVHAMNFYFYLWLLKILWPENTSSHLSQHLEFIIEQGHRVNRVSGSLDSRVTGSLGHKMWPSSISAFHPSDITSLYLCILLGDGDRTPRSRPHPWPSYREFHFSVIICMLFRVLSFEFFQFLMVRNYTTFGAVWNGKFCRFVYLVSLMLVYFCFVYAFIYAVFCFAKSTTLCMFQIQFSPSQCCGYFYYTHTPI